MKKHELAINSLKSVGISLIIVLVCLGINGVSFYSLYTSNVERVMTIAVVFVLLQTAIIMLVAYRKLFKLGYWSLSIALILACEIWLSFSIANNNKEMAVVEKNKTQINTKLEQKQQSIDAMILTHNNAVAELMDTGAVGIVQKACPTLFQTAEKNSKNAAKINRQRKQGQLIEQSRVSSILSTIKPISSSNDTIVPIDDHILDELWCTKSYMQNQINLINQQRKQLEVAKTEVTQLKMESSNTTIAAQHNLKTTKVSDMLAFLLDNWGILTISILVTILIKWKVEPYIYAMKHKIAQSDSDFPRDRLLKAMLSRTVICYDRDVGNWANRRFSNFMQKHIFFLLDNQQDKDIIDALTGKHFDIATRLNNPTAKHINMLCEMGMINQDTLKVKQLFVSKKVKWIESFLNLNSQAMKPHFIEMDMPENNKKWWHRSLWDNEESNWLQFSTIAIATIIATYILSSIIFFK